MISLHVNGEKKRVDVAPDTPLLWVLRDNLGITSVKYTCGIAECGVCTVLVDGEPVNACLIPIAQLEGRRIETVESLGSPDSLSALQESLLDAGGAQCGICTPGMLMTSSAWLSRGGKSDPTAIRKNLAGNLCRCTGYQHIVDAVRLAAEKMGA